MSIKITIPNTSSDTLTFGSANTPTAAQIAGIDSGSSNGQLAIYTTASGTSTERIRVDASGNVGIGTSSPGARVDVRTAALGTALQLSDDTNYGANFIGISGGLKLAMNGTQTFSIFQTTNERLTIDGSGNLKFNSGYGSAATAYGCRAWVNFNGTGTVAIRASANVTSITDSGVGLYDVNFTNAMPDANYAVAVTAYSANSSLYAIGGQTNGQAPATTKFRIAIGAGGSLGADTTSGYADLPYIFASVFR